VKARIGKKQHSSHPTTIADRLFQIQAEKPALKDHWIESACDANFSAGVETIGITISTFLDAMLSHPGCQARIQKEIDEARASGRLSAIPKWEEIDSLPYLSACLNESRRLHPPFAHALPRIVPRDGVELERYWLPAGVSLFPILTSYNL
jgi:cytochrome P450